MAKVKYLKKAEPKKEEPKKKLVEKLELTDKEIEVARLIWEGYTTKQIGEELENSSRTIEVHIASIYTKLNAIKPLKNNNYICMVRALQEREFLK